MAKSEEKSFWQETDYAETFPLFNEMSNQYLSTNRTEKQPDFIRNYTRHNIDNQFSNLIKPKEKISLSLGPLAGDPFILKDKHLCSSAFKTNCIPARLLHEAGSTCILSRIEYCNANNHRKTMGNFCSMTLFFSNCKSLKIGKKCRRLPEGAC
jgi:hypothetical protein